jgi:APA family basic amino acid/polyamine antiporter
LAPSPVNFENLMAATTLAVFAMLGIESASVPGEHVHEPDRTIPRATYAGTVFTALIYLSVTAVIMALIPYKQLENSQAPFVDLLSTYVGNGIGQWLAIFVVISGLGALNGFTLVSGQITRTMAVNGTMPASLGQMNAHHAPVKSLLLGGVLATIMVLMNYSKSLVDAFTFMALIITAANLPLYFFSAIALMRMKNKNAIERFGLFASFAMLALVFVVFAFIGIGLEAFIWIVVLALMGLPVYYIMRRSSKNSV